MKTNLITLIEDHKIEVWNDVIKTASDCYKMPHKFWSKINRIRGKKIPLNTYLTHTSVNDDSEDSDFGNESTVNIIEPQEQANLLSSIWSKIFTTNNDPEFNNSNTRKVYNWNTNNHHNLTT